MDFSSHSIKKIISKKQPDRVPGVKDNVISEKAWSPAVSTDSAHQEGGRHCPVQRHESFGSIQ